MNAIALKMKRTSLLVALMAFFALAGTRVAAQGIEFFHGTWAEAMAKSRAEGKPIFVDAYTSWCGPCRWMSANIFTDAAVGQYFNANFINVKLDMEKGEGVEFARTHKVMAYPTLFTDGLGNEKLRQVGAVQTPDALINLGETVKSR
jgi:thiol-disulfide isomerase/thioredoxin